MGPSTETTETTAVIAEGKSDNNMLMKQLSNFNDTNLAYPIGALINGRGHGGVWFLHGMRSMNVFSY